MVITVIYLYRCRFDAVAHARRLADDCWKGMDKEDEEEEEEVEEMDVQVSVRKPGRHYRNQVVKCDNTISWAVVSHGKKT